MNQKYIFYIILVTISLNYTKLNSSSYGPSLLFHKPYNNTPYLADYYMSFSAGQTDQAYNKNGQTVPFLQQYGSEDLLKKFLDPSLPQNNIERLGTIDFSGTFNFQRLNLFYSKNIDHDMFIGIATTIQNLSINNIGVDIHLTEKLNEKEEYQLEIFKKKITKNINSSGIYEVLLMLGYNKIFTNFKSLKFLQLFLKGSLGIPQWLHGNNVTILQYPLGGNIAFSYPVTTTLRAGITKHCNIGGYGLFIPFQSTELTGMVNKTNSNNQFLLTERTRIKIKPQPVFSSVLYIETHSFIPNFMATIGYGYTYGMKWNIQSFKEKDFSTEIINKNKLLNAFSVSSLFFQLNYSFANDKSHHAPTVSIFYTFPLAGSFYPKIQIIGGSYNMAITYEF